MKWAHAITRLQQANAAVLACSALDVTGIREAMRERDHAVRAIAALKPQPLSRPELARFQMACDDGARIREKLDGICPSAQARLQRAKRVLAFLQNDPTPGPRQPSYD